MIVVTGIFVVLYVSFFPLLTIGKSIKSEYKTPSSLVKANSKILSEYNESKLAIDFQQFDIINPTFNVRINQEETTFVNNNSGENQKDVVKLQRVNGIFWEVIQVN